jgi:hypothetical protein
MYSTLGSMDLFDSFLVDFNIQGLNYLVPAARVVSGHVNRVGKVSADVEAGVAPLSVHRLGPNDGTDNGWPFRIASNSHQWLYFVDHLQFHVDGVSRSWIVRR